MKLRIPNLFWLLAMFICACDRQGPKLAEVELLINTKSPTEDIHVYVSNQTWGDFGFSGGYRDHLFVKSGEVTRLPDIRSFSHSMSLSFNLSHPYFFDVSLGLRLVPQPDGTVVIFAGDDEKEPLQSCSALKGSCLSISEGSRIIKKGQRIRLEATLLPIEPLLDREAERRRHDVENIPLYLKYAELGEYISKFEKLSPREQNALLIQGFLGQRNWEFYFLAAKQVTGDDLIDKYVGYFSTFYKKYALNGDKIRKDDLRKTYKDFIKRVEAEKK